MKEQYINEWDKGCVISNFKIKCIEVKFAFRLETIIILQQIFQVNYFLPWEKE